MTDGALRPVLDMTSAAWIAPRLSGEFGAVTRFVPSGYEAYARVCHPVRDEHGAWVSWSDVADVTGRRAHPTMQWHALIGSTDSLNPQSSLWSGENPRRGDLASHALVPLCGVLGGHTQTPEACWFCLWQGYGWVHDGSAAQTSRTQIEGARVRHPSREYLLFSGQLDAATQMGDQVTPEWLIAQSPNLFWPDDHAWCVATEIDLDSTLVAGSNALINELLRAPALEVWPIAPDDSLAADADRLNDVR